MYGALIVDAVLFGCLSKKKIPTKNRFMKPLGEKNQVSRLYSYNNFTAVLYNSFLGCGVIMSHPSHKKRRKLQPELLTVSGYVFLWYTVFIHFPPKSTQFCRQTMAIILVSGYGRSL